MASTGTVSLLSWFSFVADQLPELARSSILTGTVVLLGSCFVRLEFVRYAPRPMFVALYDNLNDRNIVCTIPTLVQAILALCSNCSEQLNCSRPLQLQYGVVDQRRSSTCLIPLC